MNITIRFIGISLFLIICIALPAQAKDFVVGTRGASITMDEGWQRRTLTAGVGPDQFAHESGIFSIFLEDISVLERRADFEAELEQFIESFKQRAEGVEADPEVRYERDGRIGRCSRRLSAKVMSLDITYQLDLVSRDGLGYLLMTWAEASRALDVYATGGKLARSLSFPGSESEWGKACQPSQHTFAFAEWRVQLTFRDSVFPSLDDETPGTYSLSTAEDDIALRLFLEEFDVDIEAALDEVIEVVTKDTEMEELFRSDLDIEAGIGRQALLRQRSEQGNYDIAVALIPAGDGTFVDIRFVTMGLGGHRERLFQEVLASLKVVPPTEIDAFPIVEEQASEKVDVLGDGARSLLLGSDQFGSIEGWLRSVKAETDNSVIVLESKRVIRLVEGEEPSILYSTNDWIGSYQLVVDRDDVLLIDNIYAVSKIVDRKLVDLDFEARFLAPVPGGLLVVGPTEKAEMLGFDQLVAAHPPLLVKRTASGDENRVVEFENFSIIDLVASTDGTRALVAGTDLPLLGQLGWDHRVKLVEVEIEDSKLKDLGSWERITLMAGADSGWLISGTPLDGILGLYHFVPGSLPDLLISGDIRGVSLIDDELVFSAGFCVSEQVETEKTCVYRADMSLVREYGQSFSPLNALALNRIADGVMEQGAGFPATAVEIGDFMDRANAVSERLYKIGMPGSADEVDYLLSNISHGNDLSDPAMTLLAVAFSNALIEEGAIWVDSDQSAPMMRRNGTGLEAENHFALALYPVQIIISTLYQEDGWWMPASTFIERADGRIILLGHDREALEERLESSNDPRAGRLLKKAKVRPLVRMLKEHEANVHLRNQVYKHLAGMGETDVIVRIAEEFVEYDQPEGQDEKAYLASRLNLEPEGEELNQLMIDIRSAIERHPDVTALYLLLGSAYERSSLDDRRELSRACYVKVTELTQWGAFSEFATAAIERFDTEN